MSNNNKNCPVRKCPWGAQFNDEIKFFIACCQTNPSSDDHKVIHSYLNTEHFTLHTLIGLANQHGILPLVYKTIKSLPTTHYQLPAKILPEINAQYMSISKRNMLMSAELIRIIQLLEKNSIKAIAFKGPTLSQILYGDITLRQYGDLDVLVKKEDIYKIDTLLKDLGYQRVLKLTPVQEKIYIQNAQDLGFYHSKNGLLFEMHWSLLNEDYPLKINLDTIWETPQTISINQHKIKTFPTEELLTYLCIHGSKHLWERIEWIKDIDLLIRKKDIDWGKVVKQVDGSGFEAMIYLGLSLAKELFKTPLPKNVTNHISDMKILITLSDFVLENWQSPKNTFQQTYIKLKLFPGIKEQAVFLHKILIKPSLNDYQFIDLPKSFYWVYYFVHPYLLIKKYLTK